MDTERAMVGGIETNIKVFEQDYTFRVILKYWKKESKNTVINLPADQCDTVDNFIKAVKEFFEIKRFHCLEEIWVLQVRSPQEKSIQWVKEVNGRIKLHVSDAIKDMLMKRGQQVGTRDFEDRIYDYEE